MTEKDDFDPIRSLEELRANFEQPHKFAEIFCNAAEKQKSIEIVLKNIMRDLIMHDRETSEQIKVMQRSVNSEDWKMIARKGAFASWSIFMLIIGAVINKYFG